jgi:hypothetical protein
MRGVARRTGQRPGNRLLCGPRRLSAMDAPSGPRLAEVLEGWQGNQVAVRLVAHADELVAVFAGTLGARSPEKHPPWFWPVEPDGRTHPTLERRGIYVHPELLGDVRLHVGGFVVDYAQAGVTVNLRRLDAAR